MKEHPACHDPRPPNPATRMPASREKPAFRAIPVDRCRVESSHSLLLCLLERCTRNGIEPYSVASEEEVLRVSVVQRGKQIEEVAVPVRHRLLRTVPAKEPSSTPASPRAKARAIHRVLHASARRSRWDLGQGATSRFGVAHSFVPPRPPSKDSAFARFTKGVRRHFRRCASALRP